jgi:hypothetical protein
MAGGSMAEQQRSDNDDGLLTIKQSFAAVMAGAGTALFSVAGGKIAQKLGVADLDTELVKGGMKAADADLVKRGFIASFTKAGISEGVFEEMPQS